MSISSPVPADSEPDSMIDLVADCREVTGVLGFSPVPVPLPRAALLLEIDDRASVTLEGMSAYGS